MFKYKGFSLTNINITILTIFKVIAEVVPTDGLVVRSVKGSEGGTKGTLHLLVHGIVLIISLQHGCVEKKNHHSRIYSLLLQAINKFRATSGCRQAFVTSRCLRDAVHKGK